MDLHVWFQIFQLIGRWVDRIFQVVRRAAFTGVSYLFELLRKRREKKNEIEAIKAAIEAQLLKKLGVKVEAHIETEPITAESKDSTKKKKKKAAKA